MKRRALGIGPAWALLALAGSLGGAPGSGRSAEAPRINYMLECQGCHLPDGTGSPGAVPSLRNFVARFLTVPRGREYLVRVPGSAQSRLGDGELAELLNWMIRAFGPAPIARDFAAFSAGEVARYRGRPLTDVESLRRELVREIEGAQAREPWP